MNTFTLFTSCTALLALTLGASAQDLLSTSGTVIATTGDTVPDGSGAGIAGLTFEVPTGTSSPFDTPVMDASGNVLFRSRMVDSAGPLDAFAEHALFFGDSATNLKMVSRGGDAAFDLAPVLLRTSAGNLSPLGSSYRLTSDGRVFFGSRLYDNAVTITSANDSALFGGQLGSIGHLIQKGDIAPGTDSSMMGMEATFIQTFSNPTLTARGLNANGVLYTQGSLVSGTGVPPVTTTSGMNNQQGIWCGLPGNLQLVTRRSDPVSGLPGSIANGAGGVFNTIVQINNSNELLYDVSLSQTQGMPAATVVDDQALLVYSLTTGTSAKIVRESDTAPVPGGGTFNAISGDFWAPGVATNAWTRDGKVIFRSELRNTMAPGFDDIAVFRGDASGLSLVVRRGDAAPGTDAEFDDFRSTNCLHNSAGQVLIPGKLLGGTSTPGDDSGLWVGMPGSLQLAVREGDVLPGTGGGVCNDLFSQSLGFNDLCQVVFRCTITGGSFPGASLWSWDSTFGLVPIYLSGSLIETSPGLFKTTNGFNTLLNGNDDGAHLYFAHDGTVGMRVSFDDGTYAVMTTRVPSDKLFPEFCNGDGGNQMGCTNCPCSNETVAGTIGGCINSAGTSARLEASGSQSVSLPSGSTIDLRFALSGAPANAFCILNSGDGLAPGNPANPCFGQGSGSQAAPFDGLRCAITNTRRHGGRSADSNGDVGVTNAPWGGEGGPPVGIGQAGGGFLSGQTRYFQVINRDDAMAVCMRGLNTSQAIEITFTPRGVRIQGRIRR